MASITVIISNTSNHDLICKLFDLQFANTEFKNGLTITCFNNEKFDFDSYPDIVNNIKLKQVNFEIFETTIKSKNLEQVKLPLVCKNTGEHNSGIRPIIKYKTAFNNIVKDDYDKYEMVYTDNYTINDLTDLRIQALANTELSIQFEFEESSVD